MHVAYPHRAANPIPVMVDILSRLQSRVLDEGYTGFQPSNLEVTHGRRRQHRHQRHSRLGQGPGQHPLQPGPWGKDLAAWIEGECRRGGGRVFGPRRSAVQDQPARPS
ncbi:peptidase dimerization domain-containing protein [Caulobacter segnis]